MGPSYEIIIMNTKKAKGTIAQALFLYYNPLQLQLKCVYIVKNKERISRPSC